MLCRWILSRLKAAGEPEGGNSLRGDQPKVLYRDARPTQVLI